MSVKLCSQAVFATFAAFIVAYVGIESGNQQQRVVQMALPITCAQTIVKVSHYQSVYTSYTSIEDGIMLKDYNIVTTPFGDCKLSP